MKTVTLILLVSLGILSLLVERAWAPPMYLIDGKVSLISVDDHDVTGDPWHWVRVGNANVGNTSNDNNDPLRNGDDGDKRW